MVAELSTILAERAALLQAETQLNAEYDKLLQRLALIIGQRASLQGPKESVVEKTEQIFEDAINDPEGLGVDDDSDPPAPAIVSEDQPSTSSKQMDFQPDIGRKKATATTEMLTRNQTEQCAIIAQGTKVLEALCVALPMVTPCMMESKIGHSHCLSQLGSLGGWLLGAQTDHEVLPNQCHFETGWT